MFNQGVPSVSQKLKVVLYVSGDPTTQSGTHHCFAACLRIARTSKLKAAAVMIKLDEFHSIGIRL
jgi:hypothetical protein